MESTIAGRTGLPTTRTRSSDGPILATRTTSKTTLPEGLDFSMISRNMTVLGDLTPEMREIVARSIYTSAAKSGDRYYFGDGIYIDRD